MKKALLHGLFVVEVGFEDGDLELDGVKRGSVTGWVRGQGRGWVNR